MGQWIRALRLTYSEGSCRVGCSHVLAFRQTSRRGLSPRDSCFKLHLKASYRPSSPSLPSSISKAKAEKALDSSRRWCCLLFRGSWRYPCDPLSGSSTPVTCIPHASMIPPVGFNLLVALSRVPLSRLPFTMHLVSVIYAMPSRFGFSLADLTAKRHIFGNQVAESSSTSAPHLQLR